MNKHQAQAIAAVICRAIDYYRATSVGGMTMTNAEIRLGQALEAVPDFDDAEDAGPIDLTVHPIG